MQSIPIWLPGQRGCAEIQKLQIDIANSLPFSIKHHKLISLWCPITLLSEQNTKRGNWKASLKHQHLWFTSSVTPTRKLKQTQIKKELRMIKNTFSYQTARHLPTFATHQKKVRMNKSKTFHSNLLFSCPALCLSWISFSNKT